MIAHPSHLQKSLGAFLAILTSIGAFQRVFLNVLKPNLLEIGHVYGWWWSLGGIHILYERAYI
jgi:hypothetical protein